MRTVLILGFTWLVLWPIGAGEVDLGVNLNIPTDWQTSLIFADAMKTSREWGSVATPWDQAAPKDAQGWPTSDAGVVILSNIPSMSGTYKLSFTGPAQISAAGSPGVTIQNSVYNAATNVSTADVIADSSATGLILRFTGTAGGVRNVKLMRPGHTTETFTRAFLDRLAPFTCIRFQMYLQIQACPIINWADRTLPTHATQSRRFANLPAGASWEHAIELCNELDKDIWVNIPDQATDDYVLQLAALLQNTLEPGRKIYLEWSNEVWNNGAGFTQTQRNANAAVAEVALGNSPLNYDGSTNQGYWAWRRTAKRGKECSDLFRSVFGDAAMLTRVRPVLASQMGNPEILRQGLQFIEQVYGAPSRYFYAVSGAAYFGIGSNDTRTDLTVDVILAEAAQRRVSLRGAMEVFTSWAHYYKLKHVAYEGAPDNSGDASLTAKIAAARDPRMADLMLLSLNDWHEVGGDLFVYFDLCGRYSRWGSTSLMEDITQSTSRTAAIDQVNAAPRPPLTAGHLLPGTLGAMDYITRSFEGFVGNDPAGGQFLGSQVNGAWVNFLLRVPATGRYLLAPRVGSGAAGGSLEMLVNSDSIQTWELPNTGGATTWQSLPPVELALQAGLQVVRLRWARSGFNLRSLEVVPAPTPPAPAARRDILLRDPSSGDVLLWLMNEPASTAINP